MNETCSEAQKRARNSAPAGTPCWLLITGQLTEGLAFSLIRHVLCRQALT